MFNIQMTIDKKRVEDLLVTAFEGGSNYWYMIEEKSDPEVSIYDLPFTNKGFIVISDQENKKKKKYTLDKAALQFGLEVMSSKYQQHFSDVIDENDDATTGDVFLQCCLFGEVIYG